MLVVLIHNEATRTDLRRIFFSGTQRKLHGRHSQDEVRFHFLRQLSSHVPLGPSFLSSNFEAVQPQQRVMFTSNVLASSITHEQRIFSELTCPKLSSLCGTNSLPEPQNTCQVSSSSNKAFQMRLLLLKHCDVTQLIHFSEPELWKKVT